MASRGSIVDNITKNVQYGINHIVIKHNKMNSILRVTYILIFTFFLLGCSSPSDSKKKELNAGNFELGTTGVFEDNLSGSATYTLEGTTYYRDYQYLHLDLKAGKVPFVPDSFSEGYGIFFDVAWDSSGTIEIDGLNSTCLFISPSSFFPFTPYVLSSGTITIENHSQGILSGKINIADTLTPPDSGLIKLLVDF